MTVPISRLRQPRPTASRRPVFAQAPQDGDQQHRAALLALGDRIAQEVAAEPPHRRLARLLRFQRRTGQTLTAHDHRLLDNEVLRLAEIVGRALDNGGPTPIPSGNAPEDAA